MKVKEIMVKKIIKTGVGSTVSDAAKIMDGKNIGSLLIEENGKIVGIITERDILRKIVARGRDPNITFVKDIMTSPLIKIDCEKSVEDANELMNNNKIRRLIVECNGEIAGVITLRDVSNNLRYSIGKRIVEEKGTGHYRPNL